MIGKKKHMERSSRGWRRRQGLNVPHKLAANFVKSVPVWSSLTTKVSIKEAYFFWLIFYAKLASLVRIELYCSCLFSSCVQWGHGGHKLNKHKQNIFANERALVPIMSSLNITPTKAQAKVPRLCLFHRRPYKHWSFDHAYRSKTNSSQMSWQIPCRGSHSTRIHHEIGVISCCRPSLQRIA